MNDPTGSPDSLRSDSPVSPDAYSNLVSGIEERVEATRGRAADWDLYEPEAAKNEGAEPPPSDLSDPAWTVPNGWMERSETPLDSADGPILFIWAAPDDVERP
ncbi:MAG: hypothetical protein BRD55_04775 [Bacteroidetes bacterium SW_9_63_38]|nr:MAG: hypothetical protein BRD55_04775 [Bacteroidetes bacterium SW_9_63_38]